MKLTNYTAQNLAKLKSEWIATFNDTHKLTVKEYAELRLKTVNATRTACDLPPYASVTALFMNAQSI